MALFALYSIRLILAFVICPSCKKKKKNLYRMSVPEVHVYVYYVRVCTCTCTCTCTYTTGHDEFVSFPDNPKALSGGLGTRIR